MALTAEDFRDRFPKITEYTNDEEVDALLKMLKFASIQENTMIIEDNQENNALYFVMDGTLDCFIEENGKRISIGKISPGEYIGEVSVLDGGKATSSVMTETPCIIYRLTRDAFKQLEDDYPVIAGKLFRSVSAILISRLKSADKLLFDGLTTLRDKNGAKKEQDAHSVRNWFIKIYHLLHNRASGE